MAYLDRPYYVGLLSASALYGAAHQAPQELQVVTDRSLRPIEIGRVRIRFVKKARVSETPTVNIKTPTGETRVSSPEATALDLVRYIEHAGHLPNVATVLHELAERLDPSVLVRAAEADAEPVMLSAWDTCLTTWGMLRSQLPCMTGSRRTQLA